MWCYPLPIVVSILKRLLLPSPCMVVCVMRFLIAYTICKVEHKLCSILSQCLSPVTWSITRSDNVLTRSTHTRRTCTSSYQLFMWLPQACLINSMLLLAQACILRCPIKCVNFMWLCYNYARMVVITGHLLHRNNKSVHWMYSSVIICSTTMTVIIPFRSAVLLL